MCARGFFSTILLESSTPRQGRAKAAAKAARTMGPRPASGKAKAAPKAKGKELAQSAPEYARRPQVASLFSSSSIFCFANDIQSRIDLKSKMFSTDGILLTFNLFSVHSSSRVNLNLAIGSRSLGCLTRRPGAHARKTTPRVFLRRYTHDTVIDPSLTRGGA